MFGSLGPRFFPRRAIIVDPYRAFNQMRGVQGETAPKNCQLQRRGERRATINEVLCGVRRLRIYVL